MAHKRDVFIACNVLSVGVADNQVDRFRLDPLVHQVHVGPGATVYFGVFRLVAGNMLDPSFKARGRTACR